MRKNLKTQGVCDECPFLGGCFKYHLYGLNLMIIGDMFFGDVQGRHSSRFPWIWASLQVSSESVCFAWKESVLGCPWKLVTS